MRITGLLVCVALALFVPSAVRAGEPTSVYQDNVRQASRQLQVDLGRLEEVVITDTVGKDKRELYREVERAIAALEQFHRGLKPDLKAESALEQYAPVDKAIQGLLRDVRAAGPESDPLQRAGDYVRMGNEELFFSLACECGAGKSAALRRQAAVLEAAAKHLERTARYTFGARVNQAVLLDQTKKLVQAVERFNKNLKSEDPKEQQKQFAEVDQAWAQVTNGLRLLPAGENVYLLRAANRVDTLHGRLHNLMGNKGDRPRLTISA